MAICKTCKEPVKNTTPLIVDGLEFCSDYCVDFYQKRMEHLVSSGGNIYIEKLGPIGDEFINMCKKCGLFKICTKSRGINAAFEEQTHEWVNGKWCCHSICNLSTMLSDGTVPTETVKKIMKTAEDFRDSTKSNSVFPSLLDNAISNMKVDLAYRKIKENLPEPIEPRTDHYMACVICDDETVNQCLDISARARKKLELVKNSVKKIWCGHAQYALASALLGNNLNMNNLPDFIAKAEKVAEEKSETGVTHRSYYIALGRDVK